ncbi:interleukin-8-like [Acipenser ruthenus]|uniref:interleukin-8-like n=1 Tax=Acipenser ruthenus TaxID=7906 RepID=UPI001560145B|nr:interleukin-8-like [Acipenser ruthenus]
MSSTLSLTLLLMLTGCAYLINAAPLGVELRCKCVKTISDFIHPKQIANLIITQEGPHCSNTEVIITLKNGGKEICVNPSVKWVQRIITTFLHSAKGKQ